MTKKNKKRVPLSLIAVRKIIILLRIVILVNQSTKPIFTQTLRVYELNPLSEDIKTQ